MFASVFVYRRRLVNGDVYRITMSIVMNIKKAYACFGKHEEVKKFVSYFFIGVSAAILDFVLFFVLFEVFEIQYLLSNVFSVVASIVYAFTLNVVYNFRVTTHLIKRFLSYSTVSFIGMVISLLLLYVFHDRFGIGAMQVKAASLPLIFFVQFGLNRLVTFRSAALSK